MPRPPLGLQGTVVCASLAPRRRCLACCLGTAERRSRRGLRRQLLAPVATNPHPRSARDQLPAHDPVMIQLQLNASDLHTEEAPRRFPRVLLLHASRSSRGTLLTWRRQREELDIRGRLKPRAALGTQWGLFGQAFFWCRLLFLRLLVCNYPPRNGANQTYRHGSRCCNCKGHLVHCELCSRPYPASVCRSGSSSSAVTPRALPSMILTARPCYSCLPTATFASSA